MKDTNKTYVIIKKREMTARASEGKARRETEQDETDNESAGYTSGRQPSRQGREAGQEEGNERQKSRQKGTGREKPEERGGKVHF